MKYDVLIIGSGAGGSAMALRLSQSGVRVLVLEKGPRYRPQDYRHDELEVVQRNFFRPNVAREPHILIEEDPPRPQRSLYGWSANCVGGGTEHMGGYYYRFHPDDFRMQSRFGKYAEIADWPYSYAELEPYYSMAEWETGVAGLAGANPLEGPRSKAYPLPPLEEHPLVKTFDAACQRCSLRPFPTPRAINSRPHRGRPVCSYCDVCAEYGCPTGARNSAQTSLLTRAEATGCCEVRTRVMVRQVTLHKNGLAKGCIYIDAEGYENEVEASVVCVSCSAVESARLLLLSKSTLFPHGLANNNGLVGKHLQFHGASSGGGFFHFERHPDKDLRNTHPFLGRSIMDHYFLPEGLGVLPKGGLLRFDLMAPSPIAGALNIAKSRGEGDQWLWGAALKERIQHRHNYRGVGFEVFHDFIPNGDTFLELDAEIKDHWGLPVVRIYLFPDALQKVAGTWLVERGLEILQEMGADSITRDLIGETSSHLFQGTCRAGKDPANSVLNEYCQAHEVRNLFVVDGSFMPTSAGPPPTLTILANALRTADHVLTRSQAQAFG